MADGPYLAAFMWNFTGGAGPLWEVILERLHGEALAENHKRDSFAALDRLHRENPRHPLFLALNRQAKARRALQRADQAVEDECWLLRQDARITLESLPAGLYPLDRTK